MSIQREEKLKSLLESVPPGFLVDSAWLARHGIARSSAHDYVKRGWLERLERGVFRRPAPHSSHAESGLDWQTCVLSVQHIMGYAVHVGGMTALRMQGHAHYLSLGGNETVWLYGRNIPHWLGKLQVNAKLVMRSPNLFADDALGLKGDGTGDDGNALALPPSDWTSVMAGPERAILEALDELPDRESFHHLDMIFEGLTNMRPRALGALLKNCRKIKVKRLFFVFADRHNHAWRKHIKAEDFDLGRGDRALVKGGKIHPRYRIMIPAELISGDGEQRDGP